VPIGINLPNLPVLILFDLDPDWSESEQEEVLDLTSQLEKAIKSLGCQTTLVPVLDNDLSNLLAQYNPFDYIVFNWCETPPRYCPQRMARC